MYARRVALVGLLLFTSSALAQNVLEAAQEKELTPIELLGQRLFHDNRLSNPGSEFEASCNSCHIAPETPGRDRMYADVLALSMMPSTTKNERSTTKVNTPTLDDVGLASVYNHDGSYDSLENLIADKITGPHLGWEEGAADRAKKEIYTMLILDTGEANDGGGVPYKAAFKEVHGVDIGEAGEGEVIGLLVETLSAFVQSIESTKTSPYDAWAYMNRIQKYVDLENGDDPAAYAGRLFGNLMNQEGRLVVKVPKGYTLEAYNGMKTFYRYAGAERVGNCVMCHHPLLFTDNQLHNSDGIAVKTPTLRNLAKTDPYMHDGSMETLEEVIRWKMEMAEKARAGDLDETADAYKGIFITEDEIPGLVAFLNTLNDVGPSHYRELVVGDVEVLKGPFDPNF